MCRDLVRAGGRWNAPDARHRPRSGRAAIAELVATFFTEDEQRFVRDAPPRERDLRANLIWCAKEAVLKALGFGLTVDTFELSCLPEAGLADPAEWPLAPADDAWRPFVATCSPALVPGGGTIRGIWRSFPGFVGALAYTRQPSDVGQLIEDLARDRVGLEHGGREPTQRDPRELAHSRHVRREPQV